MAAVIALPQPAATSGADITTDIRNTLDARERMHALHATLTALRIAGRDAFLKAFSADLAALTTDPDKAFVDAEYAKFNTWKTADDDLAKRIEALESIARLLRERFAYFEKAYRDEVIALLKSRIATLQAQLDKEETDEAALNRRIDALADELARLTPRTVVLSGAPAANKPARARTAKRAGKKSSTSGTGKKTAKKL
jgi:hypothetical protein